MRLATPIMASVSVNQLPEYDRWTYIIYLLALLCRPAVSHLPMHDVDAKVTRRR